MKINNPCVSIIINCYNGEKYLNETLESVLNQTYNNWEVIFWDNQSTDSSAKIFKSFKDKRFHYFYASEHTSLYKARNLAIQKSNCDFISFLDTDDLWDRNKLELQMPYFKNQEVGLVYSNFWQIKENTKKKKLYINKKLPSGRIYDELINNYCVGILTTIIRKKMYLKLTKIFDERFSIIGDFDLFLRLSKICIFEGIQRPLAFYRLHGKNFSTLNKKKEVEELEMWLEENKSNLNSIQFKRIQKDIAQKKFLFAKIDGKYKECISILLNSKINLFSFKNMFLLFTPIVLLKKFLWFYNDSN